MGSVRWCRRFVFPFRSTFLLHLVWQPFAGQDYVTSFLHTDCSVPSSEFDLSIDYLRFSPLLKKFNFLKNLLSRIYIIIIPFPLWVIRKSDFQFSPKNRFKVVKFLNTRKVFHLFNFVRTPSFFDFCIGWREIKKERLVKFFYRSFSLDTQQQAKTFIPSARSVASRAVSILWSLSHLRAHVWTDRFFNCKCWTSCSDGVINTDYIFPWATSEIISTSPDCHHMRVRLKSY